jgi:hypothetical protein
MGSLNFAGRLAKATSKNLSIDVNSVSKCNNELSMSFKEEEMPVRGHKSSAETMHDSVPNNRRIM